MTNSLKPKESFRSISKRADDWGEVVLSPAFKYACEVAWSEFTLRRVAHDQFSGFRLAGAKEFLDVLLNLSEKATIQENEDKTQLQPIQ